MQRNLGHVSIKSEDGSEDNIIGLRYECRWKGLLKLEIRKRRPAVVFEKGLVHGRLGPAVGRTATDMVGIAGILDIIDNGKAGVGRRFRRAFICAAAGGYQRV